MARFVHPRVTAIAQVRTERGATGLAQMYKSSGRVRRHSVLCHISVALTIIKNLSGRDSVILFLDGISCFLTDAALCR